MLFRYTLHKIVSKMYTTYQFQNLIFPIFFFFGFFCFFLFLFPSSAFLVTLYISCQTTNINWYSFNQAQKSIDIYIYFSQWKRIKCIRYNVVCPTLSVLFIVIIIIVEHDDMTLTDTCRISFWLVKVLNLRYSLLYISSPTIVLVAIFFKYIKLNENNN